MCIVRGRPSNFSPGVYPCTNMATNQTITHKSIPPMHLTNTKLAAMERAWVETHFSRFRTKSHFEQVMGPCRHAGG